MNAPNVLVVTPQSGAALASLNAEYARQDLTRCSHMVWLRYRDTIFEMLEHNTALSCHICGMTELNPWLQGASSQLATLDHIVPRSVDRYLCFELTNLAVACFRCNNKRGAKPLKSGYTVTRVSEQLTPDQCHYLGDMLTQMTTPIAT